MLGRHKNARQAKMSYFYFSINEDGTNYTILASDLPAQSTNAALKTFKFKFPVMQFYILYFNTIRWHVKRLATSMDYRKDS